MTEAEWELMKRARQFVERVQPDLDIRDVHRVADKIYKAMRFTLKLKKPTEG